MQLRPHDCDPELSASEFDYCPVLFLDSDRPARLGHAVVGSDSIDAKVGKTLMSGISDIDIVRTMAGAEPQRQRFLVEWYGPRTSAHSIGDIVDRLNSRAASMSASGDDVQLLTAMAVPDDNYTFGVFAAESAEAVALLCRDVGAPAERISSGVGWMRPQGC